MYAGGFVGGSTADTPSFGGGVATQAAIIQGEALHVDIISSGTFDGTSTDGALRVYANGNIDVYQTAGDLDVLDAYSVSGDVMLAAANNLLGGYLATPSALGSAAEGIGEATVYGTNVYLQAGVTTIGGSIGESTLSPFFIVSAFSNAGGAVSALAAGDVYLDEEAPASTVTATSANTDDNLALIAISSDSAGFAFITALSGSIENARDDNNAIILSGKTFLTAQVDVGQSANNANGGSGYIVSATPVGANGGADNADIEAIARTGNIWLWNKGAAFTGGVTAPTVQDPYSIYAPEGTITIQTSSPLTIGQSIVALGAITEQTGTTAQDDDNLTIESGIAVESLDSTVSLLGGNNIWLESGSFVEAVSGITIVAGEFDTAPVAAAAPIAETVNFNYSFGVASMSLTQNNTAWNSNLVIGEAIAVSGSSSNNTQGDQYLYIASITNGTANTPGFITFAPGQTVTNELGASVTLSLIQRDVRIDSGAIVNTTNAPQSAPGIFNGMPADSTADITIDSANSVNILGTPGQHRATARGGARDHHQRRPTSRRRRASTTPP